MGPLTGVKVLEFGGIGPGPFAAMVLSNLGANVLRLVRPGEVSPLVLAGGGAVLRGRPSLALDLKTERAHALLEPMIASADAILEGFRPGVMERLGFGPDVLFARNPRLVYGRITGYGQDGPLAAEAGHDINYLAVSGVLSALGRADQIPAPPINLLGDYGGGGMLVALGIVAALVEAQRTGRGQVVDAAMVDGVAQLATTIYGFAGAGSWGPSGTNALDTGAHFYDVYATSDGRFVAVGAIEPRFYAALLDVLELDLDEFPQWDRDRWPDLRRRFAEVFRSRSRDQWVAAAQGREACLSPVLTLAEAPVHPYHVARSSFSAVDGASMPVPAPRFSGSAPGGPGSEANLAAWGLPICD